ncbi:MAG: hypothetical protein IPK76_22320 [Lewinellaceae bacterium]|nr:hypothetical protein [Lewinellaceae bacterium]
MTTLGNIFLALSTLIYLVMLSSIYGAKPPQSGDAAMGYPIGVILLNLAFLAFMGLTTGIIAWKGGLEWVAADKTSRYALLVFGLLGIVIVNALSGLFKYENGPAPFLMRIYSGFVPALFPLVLIAVGAILLNDGLRTPVNTLAYKLPLIGIFSLSVLGIISAIGGWLSESGQNAERRIQQMQDDEARYQQNHLKQIAACNPMQDFTNILVFTDRNHHPEVREKALAKIKSNPGWQQELVKMLEGNASLEAFTFLASNEVDDKQLLVKPVNTGVLHVAGWIRKTIQNASHESHFYADQFVWDVERMLGSVEKFQDMGVDYLPAVRQVRGI